MFNFLFRRSVEPPSATSGDQPAVSDLADPAVSTASQRLVLDVIFLAECFRYVCHSSNAVAPHPASGRGEVLEEFTLITGPRVGGVSVATHIVPVDYAVQTASRVRADPGSMIEALAALDRLGMSLVAHAHSHPYLGPGGTTPSDTDRRFAERLHRGGHQAPGIIFSRDAYLRFFAHDLSQVTIDIQGNHFRPVEGEKHVYQLDLANGNFPGRQAHGRLRGGSQ